MDEDLNRLRREVEADRGDRMAAIRYEAALQRGGRHEELRELYRFEFECPKQWSDLKPTRDPLVRNCDACKRKVHFATGPEEFQKHVAARHCVAVLDSRSDARLLELAATPGQRIQEKGRPPCLVPSDLATVLKPRRPQRVRMGRVRAPNIAAMEARSAVEAAIAADLGITRAQLVMALERAFRERASQARRRQR